MSQKTYFIYLGRVVSCTNNLRGVLDLPLPPAIPPLLAKAVKSLELVQCEMREQWEKGNWPKNDNWGGKPKESERWPS